MSALRFGLIRAKTRARQIAGVSRAILRGQISFYPRFVERFEERFADYVGTRYALSFCNGTSAIEAALFAAGVGPGDEVIVPSCTYHASIDPIFSVGAVPVFADVDAESLTLSATDVAGRITDRTKAMIVVHLFGTPADMTALDAALNGRGIATIEDASHAHGARVGDRMVGSLSDTGVFSLQGSKAVAGGEGGVACTDSEESYLRMSMWGHFNRHADRFDTIGAEAFRYTGLGYKRRMAPVGATIADADLTYLEQVNRMMRDNTERLDDALRDIDGFRGLTAHEGGVKGGFWGGYPILADRDGVTAADAIAALQSEGFRVGAYPYPLHHKMRIYTDPGARSALSRGQDPGDTAEAPAPHLPVTERAKTHLLHLSKRDLITLNRRGLAKIKATLDRL